MPQFSFLKALCVGRTSDITAFENALTEVIIKYPKEPVKEKAQEMIDMIKKQKNPELAIKDTVAIAASPKFIFNEEGNYFCVIVVENGKGDLNKFKTKLSDFNTLNFSTEDIGISSIFLDVTHQLVSVKTFDGKAKAMDYYTMIKSNKDLYLDLTPGTFQSFVISEENYSIFYKEKNISNYQEFFTQNFK